MSKVARAKIRMGSFGSRAGTSGKADIFISGLSVTTVVGWWELSAVIANSVGRRQPVPSCLDHCARSSGSSFPTGGVHF